MARNIIVNFEGRQTPVIVQGGGFAVGANVLLAELGEAVAASEASADAAEAAQAATAASAADAATSAALVAAQINAIGTAYATPTKATLAAATVSGSIDFVRVGAFATGEQSGDWLFRRVGSMPSHTAYIQSADGAFWEYAETEIDARFYGMREGASAVDNRTALTAAMVAGNAMNKAVFIEGGDITVAAGAGIAATSGRCELDTRSTNVIITDGTGLSGINISGSSIGGGGLTIDFPNYNTSSGWVLVSSSPNAYALTDTPGDSKTMRVNDATQFVVGRSVSIRQQRIAINGQNRGYMTYGEKNRIRAVTPVVVGGFPNAADIEFELPLADSYLSPTAIKTGVITARTTRSVTLGVPAIPITVDQLLGCRITVDGQVRYIGGYNATSGVLSIETDPSVGPPEGPITPTDFSPLPTVGAAYTIDAPTYLYVTADVVRPVIRGKKFTRDPAAVSVDRAMTFTRCFSPQVEIKEAVGWPGNIGRFISCMYPRAKGASARNDLTENSNGFLFTECRMGVWDLDQQTLFNLWQPFDSIGSYLTHDLIFQNGYVVGQNQSNATVTTHGGIENVTFRDIFFISRGSNELLNIRGGTTTVERCTLIGAPRTVGGSAGAGWILANSGKSLTLRDVQFRSSGITSSSLPVSVAEAGNPFIKLGSEYKGDVTIDGLSGYGLTGDVIYIDTPFSGRINITDRLDLDIVSATTVYLVNSPGDPFIPDSNITVSSQSIRVTGGGVYGGINGVSELVFDGSAKYQVRLPAGEFRNYPCPANNATVRLTPRASSADARWSGALRNPAAQSFADTIGGGPTLAIPTDGPYNSGTATGGLVIIGLGGNMVSIKNGTATTYFGMLEVTPQLA